MTFALVALSYLLSAGGLALYVSQYATNLLYWDQWDFYNGLFDSAPLWDLFRWQHGPHRMGLGYLLIAWYAPATNWDTRADSWAIFGSLCLAAALALALKAKLFGRLDPADAVIPPLFLGLGSWEHFVVTPNPSLAALPVLLEVSFAFALVAGAGPRRDTLLACLAAVAVYTGFALFLAPVAAALLGLDWRRTGARSALFALVAVLLAIASYFVDFNFVAASAVDCSVFFHAHPLEYVQFLLTLAGSTVGFPGPHPVSVVLLTAWAGLCAYAWTASMQRTRPSACRPLAVLFAVPLLFGLGAAMGRACLGADQAAAVRYRMDLIPALLAVYLSLWLLPHLPFRVWAARGAAVLLIASVVHVSLPSILQGQEWHRLKESWVDCYLGPDGSIASCTERLQFAIYPRPEATGLQRKLDYLRDRGLNLYARPPAPGGFPPLPSNRPIAGGYGVKATPLSPNG